MKSCSSSGDNISAPEKTWFVVWVKSRAEKSVRDSLTSKGFEAYVASRHEMHTWRRGERRKVERVLIPSVVFVRMTKKDRLIIEDTPNVCAIMLDPAKRGLRSKGLDEYASISDDEMRLFQQMLMQDDVDVGFTNHDFAVGDYVRILDFDESCNRAQIVRVFGDNKTYVGVRVSFLGCAYMQVPLDRIEKEKEE